MKKTILITKTYTMNIPQNFEKITDQTFHIGTTKFRVDTDHQAPGDVWVYCEKPQHTIWPLCFDIDWKNETYTLIKCQPGQGRSGSVVATDAPLIKFLMKDAHSFVHTFLKDIVNTLMNTNLI
jgi:hypothetical protein